MTNAQPHLTLNHPSIHPCVRLLPLKSCGDADEICWCQSWILLGSLYGLRKLARSWRKMRCFGFKEMPSYWGHNWQPIQPCQWFSLLSLHSHCSLHDVMLQTQHISDGFFFFFWWACHACLCTWCTCAQEKGSHKRPATVTVGLDVERRNL